MQLYESSPGAPSLRTTTGHVCHFSSGAAEPTQPDESRGKAGLRGVAWVEVSSADV